jgi:hypothetical protein
MVSEPFGKCSLGSSDASCKVAGVYLEKCRSDLRGPNILMFMHGGDLLSSGSGTTSGRYSSDMLRSRFKGVIKEIYWVEARILAPRPHGLPEKEGPEKVGRSRQTGVDAV